jgi:hypothetical protein
MRLLPFGVSLASIIAGAARAGITRSNVLWHVPQTDTVHTRTGRYKVGQAFGFNHGRHYQPHGKRECERRRRQIERGQLKAENGLVI